MFVWTKEIQRYCSLWQSFWKKYQQSAAKVDKIWYSLLNTACIHCCHPREDVVIDTGQRVMIMSFQIVCIIIINVQSYVINCLFRFLYWFYIACIHTVLCVYVCYMLLINTLTLTLIRLFCHFSVLCKLPDLRIFMCNSCSTYIYFISPFCILILSF